MADYPATQKRSADNLVVGMGDAYSVKNLTATYTATGALASGSTITFGRIPSNARILGASRIYTADLATSGSPTLDIGLIAVNGNITSDPDAINDGIAISTATDAAAIKTFSNIGLPAWDFVASQTSDPGGEFIVRGVVKDAATTTSGAITLDLYYVVD